jgi:hypothetical protein
MVATNWKLAIPKELSQIADLCAAGLEHRGYYVYYLYEGTEIVYVGQTTNVMSRMVAHSVGKSRKSFDGALYRLCDDENAMRRLEHEEIERINPRLNKRRGLSFDVSQQEFLDNHPAYLLGRVYAEARAMRQEI